MVETVQHDQDAKAEGPFLMPPTTGAALLVKCLVDESKLEKYRRCHLHELEVLDQCWYQ
jgi:hypothetical protein